MTSYGVHRAHCCARHGCKYGEDDVCPVRMGLAPQDYRCEHCFDDDEAREQGMHYEYRAVVVCSSDPCSYCRQPATEHVQEAFTALREQDAREHGQAMARNVYGASVHRVRVQRRTVTEWS